MQTRADHISQLTSIQQFDIIIIGGGASGLGAAVDAASRGLKTVLFEGSDFAKGTSSRSTKLVHGGVRYLAQGNIKLVKEALKERGLLAQNAAHLFNNQTFIIPNYKWWQGYYYSFGLKVYEFLSGKLSLGKSRLLGKTKVAELLPSLIKKNLSSGVSYRDGQFDDARLALNLAQTAALKGAVILNYFKVTGLLHDDNNSLNGVIAHDLETENTFHVNGKVIINATGVFANKILKMDGRKKDGFKIVPSQGIHLVLEASFLDSDKAIMIPKTSDGRVLFVIPWHNKVVVGTTDTPNIKPNYEPKALDAEIEFVLQTASDYLTKKPTRKDVLSVFAGLRPLVAPEGNKQNTKEISRGHKIMVSDSGLVSIVGGKWTTYRFMAEQLIDQAIITGALKYKTCQTENLSIHGNVDNLLNIKPAHRYVYGSDLKALESIESQHQNHAKILHPNYEYTTSEVIFGVRHEMARTVEDILARRNRLLFLDAKAAIEAAPLVAKIMAKELKKDDAWAVEQTKTFVELAKGYLIN
ncbi:MAG: glycerol-3-phosphate dehydrogenase/oxidase [Psychroserpens sp.]|uniref:glycerol-3-phosphate dehydrogenase/oxidase n=1 Tax=Psychroserpens sp. TaxID=2020870 RepID=UPI003CBF1EA5